MIQPSSPTQLRISKPKKEHFRATSKEFPDQNLRQIDPGFPEL